MSKTKRRKPTQNDDTLFDAMEDNLSPEAVAAIAAYLVARPTAAPNASVNKELNWFTDRLVELVGGDEAFNRLCEELGL